MFYDNAMQERLNAHTYWMPQKWAQIFCISSHALTFDSISSKNAKETTETDTYQFFNRLKHIEITTISLFFISLFLSLSFNVDILLVSQSRPKKIYIYQIKSISILISIQSLIHCIFHQNLSLALYTSNILS